MLTEQSILTILRFSLGFLRDIHEPQTVESDVR